MKAIKIHLHRVSNYHRFVQDRDYIRPGETVSGVIHFDPPGKNPPADTRVVLSDALGRDLRSVPGRWNEPLGYLEFSIPTEGLTVTLLHFLDVEIEGRREARERLTVTRPRSDWDDFHIFVWAHYPPNYYDALRELGFDGVVAYKREQADHVLESGFHCYVDQVSPEEISVYHRPYQQYWEIPEKLTNPGRQYKWFEYHWDMIRQRYKKVREKLNGKSVAEDLEARKTLYRISCPSDPKVIESMRERILTTVSQHKPLRPLFYNLCDEPGVGDQAAPFDFCYCRHCLEAFRPWLEKRYGDLPSLNRGWGTHFKAWREVIPRTVDDILDRQKTRKDFNFSSWADHREFMDQLMNSTYARMREFGREADPHSLYGNTGGQGPNAYGGWDFAGLVKSVDLHVPYNVSQNDEMIRSFPPRILKMAPYFGADKRLVRRMWYQAFHGDCGQIHWDNHEPSGTFVRLPDRKHTAKAVLMGPAMAELKNGMGKQLLSMKRRSDGILFHHSQASVRAHWMMGAIPLGGRWIDRGSTDCEVHEYDVSFRLRDSLTKLVSDEGFSGDFMAYDDIASGGLQKGPWKILFLHHSMAMSAAECDAVRLFAERGGVVVADAVPAIMDEHCRLLPKGQLDDFFGVRRDLFEYRKEGRSLEVTGRANPLGFHKGRLALRACEPTLHAVEPDTVRARAGKADALIIRRAGQGFAVYLNADLRRYCLRRYQTASAEALDSRRLIRGCLALAGIASALRVATEARGPVPGLEVSRFTSGPLEMVGLVVNEMRQTSGVGEEKTVRLARFDKPTDIRVDLGRERHVYDSRAGKYLGKVSGFRDRFNPMDAKVYALLPHAVKGINMTARGPFKRGEIVTVYLSVDAGPGRVRGHVVRCDACDPSGRRLFHYSGNLLLADGGALWDIPLALNDPEGIWTLNVRDIPTGLTKSLSIEVRG